MICSLLLLASAFTAPPAAKKCSYSGVAHPSGSGCVCDAPFGGANCSALAFQPVAPSRITTCLNFTIDGARQATWGGSPMRDERTGLYHLFFSWFKMVDNSTVPSVKWWFNTSIVAHAVSKSPGDGYAFVDVVLPPRGSAFFDGSTTHNPTITKLSDGTYALYYIGLNCHNYSATDCIKHQWIGAAHATTLDGPWTRLDRPVLTGATSGAAAWEGGMVANPGVLATAGGGVIMAYRGHNDRGIGIATAPRWSGPYTRLNKGAAVLGPASCTTPPCVWSNTRVDEDMTLFQDARGTIQMILHQEGVGGVGVAGQVCGAHAVSIDEGKTWTVVGGAYTLSADGIAYARRERPQLLKEGAEDATLTYLFNGVEDSDGYTHTIATPLRTA